MNFMSTADADTEIETVEVTGGGRGGDTHTYIANISFIWLKLSLS